MATDTITDKTLNRTYRKLKSLSGQSIFESNPCSGEFNKYVRKFGWIDEPSLEVVYGWCLGEDVFGNWNWLLNNGYATEVKEKKPERTYHKGQEFINDPHPELPYTTGPRYILATGEAQENSVGVTFAVLVNIDARSVCKGETWERSILVKNPQKITQAEFDEITNNQSDQFELCD